MQRAFGVDVPETVAEMCRPAVTAVLVYDAQVGILAHVLDREALVQRIGSVLGAARDAGALVFDELGMSALVGTPVEAVLRDRGVTTLVLVGAVLEIGIEPTARHAADLGFLPVVVDDACGVVEAEAGRRSLATLDHTLLTHRASAADVVAALTGGVDPGP